MIEIRNEELVINGHAIGNEDQLISICEKAKKWDELKAHFKRGDSQ